MALPMVLFFERHWDTIPKKVLKKLLTALAELGYDTLCFERPQNLTFTENIQSMQTGIDFVREQIVQAKSFLVKAGVKLDKELWELPFVELCNILQEHVSSKRYMELAELIKNLPGHEILLEIMNEANVHEMLVLGTDINEDHYYSIVSQSYDTRITALKDSAKKREMTMGMNLIGDYQQRKGVAYLGGALHSNAIIEILKKGISEDQILAYLPHSPENLMPDENDFEGALKDFVPMDRRFLLRTEADVDHFIARLLRDIEVSNIHTVSHHPQSNSHATLLAAKFKHPFEVYLRQSCKADARLEVKDEVNAEAIAAECKQYNIPTRFHLFKNKKYLIVEDINTKEVATNIRKMSAV
ncbi:MAG: hypothetical protein P4M14_01040 [Gammaproteobacteria bacterium]|nr:hypothetical protein [Gammaproteobacteria bacterium]